MANIIINDVDPYNQYTATASQTNFTYSFPIRAASDLKVYLTPDGYPPDDASQLLILNIDYTVTGVDTETGGEVILTNGADAGDQITIVRNLPMERLQNYVQNTEFNVEDFNRDFNNLIMMTQQIRRDTNKFMLRYQNSSPLDTKNLALPLLDTGQIWKKTTLGIEALTLEENLDVTTLRSELANNQPGTDGSRLIGFYDTGLGSITVHDAISQLKFGSYGVDTGSANTYVSTLSPAPTAYFGGMLVNIRIANDNTGASTLNLNALGAKNVVMAYQGAVVSLPPTALISGMIAQFVYDDTAGNFKLMNSDRIADFKTGWIMMFDGNDARITTGWIPLDDGTIGNAASGASTRANADVEALYVQYWEDISDPSSNSRCPVTGGLGASAIDDFNANKPLQLPFREARSIGRYGTASAFPTFTAELAEVKGAPTHTITIAESASHGHPYTYRGTVFPQTGSTTDCWSGEAAAETGSVGRGQRHNTVHPVSYTNMMIKL